MNDIHNIYIQDKVDEWQLQIKSFHQYQNDEINDQQLNDEMINDEINDLDDCIIYGVEYSEEEYSEEEYSEEEYSSE
jgi:hypothetical protein